jgi:hypothetical protein
LSLALDVSSSVDDAEYQLQLDGVVAALNSDAVQEILFAQPQAPIQIHVFEWSGPVNHTILVPWTAVTTPADLARVSMILQSHQRGVAAPTTSIGSAMLAGFSYLEQQPECWRRTLDISGDGETNTGPAPEDIGEDQRPRDVVVNGLVVGSTSFFGDGVDFDNIEQLAEYYRAKVIRGPGAFVEIALGYEDYAAAMERKLMRELAAQVVGQTPTEMGRRG